MIDLSLIVVSHNTRDLLAECLHSVAEASASLNLEIWVVDNASQDGSIEMVAARFPSARLVQNEQNVGFAAANNQALRLAQGRCLFLLNSDARLTPGCLTALLAVFEQQPRAGICGPRLLNPDGSYQPSWGDLPTPMGEFVFQSFLFKIWPYPYPYSRRVHPWLKPQYERLQPVGWVSGAALVLRREVYETIGGLPEDTFMYGEDMRFCAQARQAGFEVVFAPGAQVYHHMQASSRQNYARWIENYTAAVLTYYQHYGSPGDLRQVALWIVLGSNLRRMLWSLMSWTQPSRQVEARSRLQGYTRAVALARQAARLTS